MIKSDAGSIRSSLSPCLSLVPYQHILQFQLNPVIFRGFGALQHLQLSGNGLRRIENATFQSLLQLRTLNLSSNALDALHPDVFGSTKQKFALLQLDLSENNLKQLMDNQFQSLGRLQVLDMSHNSISSLSGSHLAGLQSLRKLYLHSNDIVQIKPNTFAALEDLDTLDLSHNNIESLDEHSFGKQILQRMDKLRLSFNSLKQLHPQAFASLLNLRYLSLDNNELLSLDAVMFTPLRQLQKMHLGHNQLSEIKRDVLASLPSIVELLIDNNKLTFLPELNGTLANLKRVAIEGNPWQCACFEQLERWLLARHIIYFREGTGFYSGEKPLCVVTELAHCVQSPQEDRIQDIMDEFEQQLSAGSKAKESR